MAAQAKPLFQYKTLECLDAAENVHFSRELESILPDLVRTEIAPTSVRSLFPVNTSFSPNTQTITWRQVTVTGAAKIIADYADDIPMINLFGEEKSSKVRTIAVGTFFGVDEISASNEGTISLSTEGPVEARDAILRKENLDAYNGNATYDMVGLFSGTATTGIAQTAASGTWLLSTVAEVYGEMVALIGDIHEDSKTVHNATRMLMSPVNFRHISTTQFSTATDTTILGFFQASHPGVEVMSVQEFSGAGAKGGMGAADDAVFAYNPNPAQIFLAIPMAIEQRAPVELRLKIETIYRSKTGGFIIRKPLSMKFLTGT